MAIVLDKYRMYQTYADAGLNTTTVGFDFNPDIVTTLAEADTAAAAIVALYSPLTKAKLQSYGVIAVYVDDAFVAPIVDAEVEMKALIAMRIEGHPNKSDSIEIPAPIDALFGPIGTKAFNEVNLANAALVSFTNEFKTLAGRITFSDGEHVPVANPLLKGTRTHHKSKKG